MYRIPEVLIIDDEPLMRISLSDALKAEGYNVASAATGSEGLNISGMTKIEIHFRMRSYKCTRYRKYS